MLQMTRTQLLLEHDQEEANMLDKFLSIRNQTLLKFFLRNLAIVLGAGLGVVVLVFLATYLQLVLGIKLFMILTTITLVSAAIIAICFLKAKEDLLRKEMEDERLLSLLSYELIDNSDDVYKKASYSYNYNNAMNQKKKHSKNQR